MNAQQRIMVVDDDPNICQLIRLYLEKEGYHVEQYLDGISSIEAFKNNPPNLVILDIMLPGMDGWEVCKEIRKISDIPIIMLTAKGETFDKVLGLELGADDYIVKPFDPKELVARVKAVLRRSRASGIREKVVSYPNLTIDIGNYTVEYHGKTMELPPKELELLYFLASHPNKVFTREQLLDRVWGYDFYGDTRTVDVHIKRLREKFDNPTDVWHIKTVWGVGYKFEVK
ncbi:DNA-binding response OmpR family regulator [Caldicoprobacter guelmensis]|uniref:response regulator transcription factor n=1 Tax=Caldicoprobacter guelmensis TaxID=1170224 RepID=UPI0019595B64|nr:response regulator transcription factor [Caldicoprobacter guelmensis]MBM7581665.1 DNA-binding response OmpR family regulator [Caldicoprobacter guelmensis]